MRELLTVKRSRVGNLFRMDFHKMLHGKAFYVMLVLAAYLPIMMITQMGGSSDIMDFLQGNGSFESFGTLLVSMSGVLTGVLLCIYIGDEYSSGFMKNISAAHANKFDYIISKGTIALICNFIFTAVYLLAIFAVGALMGMNTTVPSAGGMLWYVIEKLILSVPMSLLIVSLALLLRGKAGMSGVISVFVSMGIVIKLAQMALQFAGLNAVSKVLDFTITGASSYITMTPDSSIVRVAVTAVVWTFITALAANQLMNKRDIL